MTVKKKGHMNTKINCYFKIQTALDHLGETKANFEARVLLLDARMDIFNLMDDMEKKVLNGVLGMEEQNHNSRTFRENTMDSTDMEGINLSNEHGNN